MSVEEKYGEAVRAGAHIWPGTVCRPAGPDGGAWGGETELEEGHGQEPDLERAFCGRL